MRFIQFSLFLIASLLIQTSFAALSNQLKGNPSPYLALHASDPVAWQTWSADTLAMARRENKLLFVSVGYFSCYWCHVMQHENFSNPSVARKLNRNFIPVKVDRELNPALDAYLMDFMERTRGQGGWPLNMFVTPEGNPVVGAVYLPRPRFLTLLRDMNNLWRNNETYIRDMAAKAAALQPPTSLKPAVLAPDAGQQYLTAFVQQALDNADDMSGGFGEQSKFPMIDQLHLLLTYYFGLSPQQRKDLPQLAQFLQTTLDQMAAQGLRDQLGGGFFRYTTDPTWQTPHYEKMLYDNARMARLYLDAAKVFPRKDYEAVGRETLDFMLRDLTTADGAMVSSMSAVDGANVEGGYYLWHKQELQKLLTAQEYKVVSLLWGLDRAPDSDAGYLPRQVLSPAAVARQLKQPTDKVMGQMASARNKLLQARNRRTLPVDTKQLTAWNGLALSALVAGARLAHGERYRHAAQRLRDYLVDRLWDGKHLARAIDRKGAIGQSTLADYAFAAQGLYDWVTLSGRHQDLKTIEQWLSYAWQHFYTASGWVNSDAMLLKPRPGAAIMDDGALPSASSVLLSVSWRMALTQQDQPLKQRVLAALALGQGLLQKQPFYYPNQIALLARVQQTPAHRTKQTHPAGAESSSAKTP